MPPDEVSIFGYYWSEGERELITNDASIVQHPKKQKSGSRSNIVPLSNLESLPIENLHQIFESVDLHSLISLRLQSSSLCNLVDACVHLTKLLKYAPNALRALAQTRTIRHYELGTLYHALRSAKCTYCQSFGPYLYLLSCERVCYPCLWNDRRLLTTTKKSAQQFLHLSNRQMKEIPSLMTTPGKYGQEMKDWKQHVWLVNWHAIRQLGEASSNRLELRESCSCKQCSLLRWDQYRFRAHASISFLHLVDNDFVETGFWCRGCEDRWVYNHSGRASEEELNESYFAKYRAFLTSDFLTHCSACPGIERLKQAGYPQFPRGKPEYRRFQEAH